MNSPISVEEETRYARQLIISEIGEAGQERLKTSTVLVAGAGGLGSAVSYYLCAAGIGRLGIVDGDSVELSNLNRQILHFTPDIGKGKVDSAREKLNRLNPQTVIETYPVRLNPDNITDIFREWDLVVDATDNYPSRFLIGDACFFLKKSLVTGSVYHAEGQISTFVPGPEMPCYRCLFPEPPQSLLGRKFQDGGVVGVTAGSIGLLQATEAIKFIVKTGELLTQRLLVYDAWEMTFRTVRYEKGKNCPLCGTNPRIKELSLYPV